MTHASLCKKTYKVSSRLHGSKSLFCSLLIVVLLFLATGTFLFGTAPPPTPITITTTSLPNATLGQPYLNANGNTVQLKAKGGSGTFAWCYTVGGQMNCSGPPTPPVASLLYEGLSFNSDGTITGTPTSMSPIAFSVYAENPVTQKNLSPSASFTITIGACTSTTIAPDSSTPLPTGEQGVGYPGVQFSASGCQGPYTFSAIALNPFTPNSFPTGLTLNSTTGIFLGTPTLAGTFNIVITATDAFQGVTKVEYTLTILPPPSITTTSPLPDGVVGVAYSQQITATGGTPPYTYSMNAQPPGIVNIDPNAGVIFGTPTKAGTYNFNVGVTDSLGAQTVSPFQVSFDIVASQIQVSPLSLTFNANLNGSAPPTQAITLVPIASATPPVNYTVIVDSGQSGSAAPAWLAVAPASGAAPAGLVVTVNQGTMDAGTYTGRIQVLDPIGVPTAIPVTLKVSNVPQQLTVSPAALHFAALSSTPVTLTQNLLVTNSGAGPLPFNTSVVGGNTLFSNVTASASQTTLTGPVLLQVQVNTSGLQVGAYHDTIVVSSSGGSVQVPVSLFVAGNGPILGVNTTGLLFQAIEGGGSTATQSIEVLNQGQASSTVNWSASLVSGSNWLSLTPSSGTATNSAPGVLSLALAPNATQLAPGTYYALVMITDPNSLNSPQYITASFSLQPNAGDPPPGLVPAGLFFTAPSGGTAPNPQNVQINTSSSSPLTFNAAASTPDGSTWLSVSPATGTASGQTAGSIAISVDPTSLAPGIYTGDVSVSIGEYLQSVNVTFVVQNAPASDAVKAAKPHDTGCTPTRVAATEVGLANNYAVPAGWPETITVQLNDDCGNPITGGNVVASFSNGDAPLTLTGDSFGNYSATWQPGVANPSMVVTLNAAAGALQPATGQLYGEITPNLTPPPALAPGGTLNNLNPVVGAALAPGTIAQVFGSGLAPAPVATSQLPLPLSFNNTYAMVGSSQAPLFYLSNGQVNIQIPTEITAPQQLPIVFSVNNALTLPLMLDIVPTAPGVLSANDGPNPPSVQNGAHLIAQHSADYSLVSSSSPAKPGEYLIMYLTGLGATDPSVPSGYPGPSTAPFAQVTNQPIVTVGSQTANVSFAGLAPGFVGLYQINFQVPASASSGVLEVDVTQNGVAANPTLLPVSN